MSSVVFYNFSESSAPFQWQELPSDQFIGTHDLNGLSSWGPYGKRYFGLSYLPGAHGARLDFIIGMELHRRKVVIPHAMHESGYLPWSSDADFQHYCYRQQILPKDQLYGEVHFERRGDNEYEIRVEWHNQTDSAQDVRLHLCCGLQPFAKGAWQPQSIATARLKSATAIWLDAVDYSDCDFGSWCPDGLIVDGGKQGGCLQNGFVAGQGIEWPSEMQAYSICYQLPETESRLFALRYQSMVAVDLELEIDGVVQCIQLPNTDEPCLSDALKMPEGAKRLTIRSIQASGLKLDGLAFFNAEAPEFEAGPADSFAEVQCDAAGVHQFHWQGTGGVMEIETSDAKSIFARRYRGDLDQALLLGMHNHVDAQFSAPGVGHFHDLVFGRVTVPAGAVVTQSSIVRWLPDQAHVARSVSLPSTTVDALADLPGMDGLRFGVDRLAAVLQTNVVYPVRVKGQVIRHFPPGRWWDMLYTWDCGFIGLGLGEIAPRRAIELLNTYVTEVDDTDCAFIHHGSPVPVQHYLYLDLWQKTQDRELLAFFYPRLARYLRYLAGIDSRSPTRPFQSSLLATWDLFYNSGGWDDYPPQLYLQHGDQAARARTAPMVTSSHVAVAADIMAVAARELGESAEEWETLAAALAADMDAVAWDATHGLYGYVRHDSEGQVIGLLNDPVSGKNFNQGLDGAMPWVTGRMRVERGTAICAGLTNEARFMGTYGLSTVDKTAPYYQSDGYWNGATWIPYQYVFWKAALDAGEAAFAQDLAFRVLEAYSKETEDTYNCFEHFMNDSGRGAGWHHFGGLSSPVINFFAAYCRPGRITTGFRAWIHQQDWEKDAKGVRFEISTIASTHTKRPVVLVTLNHRASATVTLNGQPVLAHSSRNGLFVIPLLPDTARQCVVVESMEPAGDTVLS